MNPISAEFIELEKLPEKAEKINPFFTELINHFTLPLNEPLLVFSILLFIILLTPILLRKLRIPAIIGLIIAGAIVGPHAFGIIGEDSLKGSGAMLMFRKIGMIYIMFIAGLELDLNEFKKYVNKSILFGILTFAVPLLLGYPICRYVLHMEHLGSLLTASMFSTHTLVAYSIVSKYGVAKNVSVAVAIGGTIITDTAVLLMFSIMRAGSKAVGIDYYLTLGVSLIIFSAIMFLIIPRLTRWFFSKLDSEKSSQFIFVLAILTFSSVLAEIAGVEQIIGAFVVGLIMGRIIPSQSSLMNRLEFIGNSLFIPFFLIGVGMVVDFKVFIESWNGVYFALVLTTFAIASKWLAAWITQVIFKFTNTERQLLFGLSSAHAAATLAIITKGQEYNMIGENVVNATIILILITCMTASFVTENAAKKQLVKQANDDGPQAPQMRSQHIMVSANELQGNEHLLDFATLITDHQVVNPISVVSVLPNDATAEARIRKQRKHLDDFISHFSKSDMSVTVMNTIDHNISSGLARMSKELVADIVVMNDSKNTNLLSRLVGDDREHLLDVCEKTVFFCQFDRPSSSYDRIVLMSPVNAELESTFSSWCERVLRLAKQLNLPILSFSTPEFHEIFMEYAARRRMLPRVTTIPITELEDIFIHNTKLNEDDLIVFASGRKGSISHNLGIETFPNKLDKAYENNDHIFIYPSQQISDAFHSNYENIATGPIAVGMEAVQKIRKELGNIFNLDKDEGDVDNDVPK